MYFDCGIVYLSDLLFSLDNLRSYESLKSFGLDTNFSLFDMVSLEIVCLEGQDISFIVSGI